MQLVKGGKNGEGHAGIGHILYAIKDNSKLPARIHSAKLKDSCKKWSPYELEALACAAAIVKEVMFALYVDLLMKLLLLSWNQKLRIAPL